MGKKGKSLRREKKRLAKRAQKSANRAKYAEWKRTGNNSKRNKAKRKKSKFNPKKHPNGSCGNIGCDRCNPAGMYQAKDYGNKNDPKIISLNQYRRRVYQKLAA